VANASAELDPTVRVRFCPSPTGNPHVGLVRTALFNWAFARHHGGTLVFRIEDTDVSRETVGAIDQIQRSLDWLGLEFDESPRGGGPHPPYLQSERLEVYRETAAALVAAGAAYPCYQTPEELEAARAVAREQTLSTRVDITPPCMRPTGWRSSSRIETRARACSGSSSSHSVPTKASKCDCRPRGSSIPPHPTRTCRLLTHRIGRRLPARRRAA